MADHLAHDDVSLAIWFQHNYIYFAEYFTPDRFVAARSS